MKNKCEKHESCILHPLILILMFLPVIKTLPATEARGRVVNTPASYSGDTGFKSRHGDRLSQVVVVFLSLSIESRNTSPGLRIRPRRLNSKSFPLRGHSVITLSLDAI
jgi:hypothetical protein